MPVKGRYKNLKEKGESGEYELIDPLDYLILRFVEHEEGSMSLGLFPIGNSSGVISKKFTPEQQKVMTTSAVSTRLRILNQQGLVTPTRVAVGRETTRHQWQRTSKGSEILKQWEATNGSGSSSRGTVGGS